MGINRFLLGPLRNRYSSPRLICSQYRNKNPPTFIYLHVPLMTVHVYSFPSPVARGPSRLPTVLTKCTANWLKSAILCCPSLTLRFRTTYNFYCLAVDGFAFPLTAGHFETWNCVQVTVTNIKLKWDALKIFLNHEDGGNGFFQNVSTHLSNFTASHPAAKPPKFIDIKSVEGFSHLSACWWLQRYITLTPISSDLYITVEYNNFIIFNNAYYMSGQYDHLQAWMYII